MPQDADTKLDEATHRLQDQPTTADPPGPDAKPDTPVRRPDTPRRPEAR